MISMLLEIHHEVTVLCTDCIDQWLIMLLRCVSNKSTIRDPIYLAVVVRLSLGKLLVNLLQVVKRRLIPH